MLAPPRSPRRAWLLPLLALLIGVLLPRATQAARTQEVVPLVIGHRTIHVFRSSLGDITAAERARSAEAHIQAVLDLPGDGWTSIEPSEHGVVVAIDGRPMFTVTTGDARASEGESPESLANQASRALQRVWTENREHGDQRFNVGGIVRTLLAFGVLALALLALGRLARITRVRLAAGLRAQLGTLHRGIGGQVSRLVLGFVGRAAVALAWGVGLVAVFTTIGYALEQFAITRPVGEQFLRSFQNTLYGGLRSAAGALPGLFVAILVFVLARIATQVSNGVFAQIAAGRQRLGALDAHTAPATRTLVNTALWLFALVMAYPYLPGSHTEAFKGLSVLVGIMMSIGASGLVGQIASGMILVFTRSLLIGEYVRILDCEGTVTELGMCVTRLKTGTGEEVALPNSLVLGQITHNYSRHVRGGGYVLDTRVTIGYDVPWRQVHELLLAAARELAYVRRDPAPFVVQTSLTDFAVEYRLVVQVGATAAVPRPQARGELHAAIQDAFNRAKVQILSPHYNADPAEAKLVPEARWHGATAAGAGEG